MKYLSSFIIIFYILFFSACATVSETFTRSIGETEIMQLKDIESLLFEYKVKGDEKLLIQAEAELTAFKENTVLTKAYEAKVYGMFGEIAFYRDDIKEVEKNIELIKTTYNLEERYFLLNALIEQNLNQKIEILNKGIAEAETNNLLKLTLAELYYEQGLYKEAVTLFDEVFLNLDDDKIDYYQTRRDLAYEFMINPPESKKVSKIMEEPVLNFEQVLLFILLNTDFLDNITVDKTMDADELAEKLLDAGYLHNRNPDMKEICRRKDIAYLFLHIAAYKENNKEILSSYSRMFKESNIQSPVPDIRVSDYFFDAVLVLVEREIMLLPDGINFFPNNEISGLRLSEIISKIKALYY